MKRSVIILMMILVSQFLIASGRAAPKETPTSNFAKAVGGITNNSARIVIQPGTYIVISGAGKYLSNGNATTIGSGTIDITGDLVNNNSSGNPLSIEGTIVFSGVSEQSISGNPFSLGNVTLNNPEGVSVNCETEVEGDLDIVDGTISMDNDSNLWLPNLDIAIGGVNYLSALAVNRISEPGSAGEHESIHKRWNITGDSSGEVLITLRWTDAENNGNDFSSGNGNVWTHNGINWVLVGSYPIAIENGYNMISFYRDFNAKNDQGDYTITGDDQTLPVVLSAFNAIITNDLHVTLCWTTQSESNLSGFNLYRSVQNDLETAICINNLIPATNSSQSTIYTYLDKEADAGQVYYYWLQISEIDGMYSYHGPLIVTVENPDGNEPPSVTGKTFLFPPFPNPFNPSTTIRYEVKNPALVDIKIFNSKGQKIAQFSQNHTSPGVFSWAFNGMDQNGDILASGVYYCVMTAGKYTKTQKMVLLK